MSDPKIFVLFFIAFIGLVYILSTCQWKSPSKTKNDSHHTDGNHGNSTSNFPKIAKAMTISDQNTETNNQGEQFSIQCPDVGGNTVPIHKITSAIYRCGKDDFTDITQQISDNCNNETICVVQTTWDGSNAWLHLSASIWFQVDDNNHFKQVITDPYPGCPKEIDILYSCKSRNAQSKLIMEYGTDEENTISCASSENFLTVESAWWKSINHGNNKYNALGHVELQKCNGRNSCTINPVHYSIGENHQNTFKIPGVSSLPTNCAQNNGVVSSNSHVTVSSFTDTCAGFRDPAYGDEKELAIVYYCKDKQLSQLKTAVLTASGQKIECVTGQKIQLQSAMLKDASANNENLNALPSLEGPCNDKTSCVVNGGIDAGDQLTVKYYCYH